MQLSAVCAAATVSAWPGRETQRTAVLSVWHFWLGANTTPKTRLRQISNTQLRSYVGPWGYAWQGCKMPKYHVTIISFMDNCFSFFHILMKYNLPLNPTTTKKTKPKRLLALCTTSHILSCKKLPLCVSGSWVIAAGDFAISLFCNTVSLVVVWWHTVNMQPK